MSEKKDTEDKKEQIVSKTSSSLVFISHDSRDAEIAEEFSALLKRVSAGVLKSFRSSDKKSNQGIEYGVEWYPEIIKNIQSASDVVCLLTPNSIDRPWILFEAGMAKGKLNTPILGVALGLSLKNASNGPFAQFQNCGGDEDDLCKLVFQLVDRIPNSEPDDETIRFHVKKFITQIDQIFEKRKGDPEEANDVEYNENNTSKLFEEIKVMFQDLPSRIEGRIHSQNKKGSHGEKGVGKQLSFLMHASEFGQKNPEIIVLFTLSLLKDRVSWLYEFGKETYQDLKSEKPFNERELSYKQFIEVIDSLWHNPEFHQYSKDESYTYHFNEDIVGLLANYMHHMLLDKL